MNDDIAWAAGLFEGEGCIALRKKPKGYRHTIELAVSMTDEDVLHRLHHIARCGTVKPRTGPSIKSHWKPQWTWRTSGEDAFRFGHLMLPYFGARRRARFLEVEQIVKASRPQPRCCEWCSTEFTPTRFARERFCSDPCRDRSKYVRRVYGTKSRTQAFSMGFVELDGRGGSIVAGCIPGTNPERSLR